MQSNVKYAINRLRFSWLNDDKTVYHFYENKIYGIYQP